MKKDISSSTNALDEDKLSELREVLLGKNYALVTKQIKLQSRDIVKDVVAEALYDRQKQDNTIESVLTPIVERSVESSVSGQSDKLIGSLYPLVGGLVRKSVKAFLSDFIEKANQLLENSFTVKGLKWRFKAHQAGMSFAQYIASQTFVYRVEHILLIHRETGILLKSVDHNQFGHSDVDLISSMLTAINDFVADSLVQRDESEEQLQTIRTDNFSLLIKPGPYAMIVVAVTGNPPHRLLDQMQLTLENIHQIYGDDMRAFAGDVNAFDDAGNQLRSCLLSEEKTPETTPKKKPWLIWAVFGGIFLCFLYFLTCLWESQQLTEQITELNKESGYVIQSLNVKWNQRIELDVIRDPDTLGVKQWLNDKEIDTNKLILNEYLFYSTEPELINLRLEKIFKQYPSIKYEWLNERLVITGQLLINKKQVLLNQIVGLGNISSHFIDTSKIIYTYDTGSLTEENANTVKSLFYLTLAKFNMNQLNFNVGSNQLSSNMKAEASDIYFQYKELTRLADLQKYHLSLILIGTSDSQGSEYANNQLSLARAINVKAFLVEKGLNEQSIYTSNIGAIKMTNISLDHNVDTRKVLFNVVYVDISDEKIEN